jgi:hypothetical protein
MDEDDAARTTGEPNDPEAVDEPSAEDEPFVRPVDRFRRTAGGTVVAAGLLGLRDVMEGRPEREEVTIVNEAPTRPVGALDVVIDPEHPERTIAIVRRSAAPRTTDDEDSSAPT